MAENYKHLHINLHIDCPVKEVRAMANEKLISVISTIERAVGMIEGVSYGLCDSQASALVDAVQKIDEALEVLKENG